MNAREYSKGIINRYNDVVDFINDCTDKRIPISKETDDERNDLSRLWLALAGNPMTKDGSFKHGQPLIYELMESYHQAKSKEEAQQPSEGEILGLRHQIQDLRSKLSEGRDYLMQVEPRNITIEDALEAFGFGRNGLRNY